MILFYLFSSFHILKICTYALGDEIEFIRMEELKEPRAKRIEGEQGFKW